MQKDTQTQITIMILTKTNIAEFMEIPLYLEKSFLI